jgi:hypothetical protein
MAIVKVSYTKEKAGAKAAVRPNETDGAIFTQRATVR